MYRVMIADDEPIVAKAMMTLTDWKGLDCEVVCVAQDGQEVLDQLESVRPDILVTDIRMPGANGIEIAKYIKEHALKVKVIILTAYADFSYAQQALKYDVVDYITKTGAFEGLENAVKKAKFQITEFHEDGQLPLFRQNFFKSVFDGTLYLSSEILQQSQKCQISLEHYVILLFHYRLDDADEERMAKVTKSLNNFFSMVFTEWMFQSVPVHQSTMAVVLNRKLEFTDEELRDKCNQAVEMMDNFMRLDAYIGISQNYVSCQELKRAYDEAWAVFESNFLDDASKISFYAHIHDTKNGYLPVVENLGKDVVSWIIKGEKKDAKETFVKFTEAQLRNDYSANSMKSSGISILNECRRLLKEQEKSLYDITDLKPSITKTIYSCYYRKEYQLLMLEIIEKTAEFLSESKNHKNRLITECERYINEHYCDNLMVGEIADVLDTSRSYLSRIFKETTGETIIATINQKKLKKAMELLSDTDMKIYEVAEALGFENVTYFSHFFKKFTGISPKEYSLREESN